MGILADELFNDPLGRGYAAMTHEEVVADFNTAYRSRNRKSLSGDEAFASTDAAEFAALTPEAKNMWLSFCGRSQIDPFSAANVAFVQYLFGGGSATIANLAALRVESISRAQELGVHVDTGLIQATRDVSPIIITPPQEPPP